MNTKGMLSSDKRVYWLYGKCMVVVVGTIRQGVVPQRNVPF